MNHIPYGGGGQQIAAITARSGDHLLPATIAEGVGRRRSHSNRISTSINFPVPTIKELSYAPTMSTILDRLLCAAPHIAQSSPPCGAA
jgi:hypothetical protein